jgi:hypothetical protein
MKQTKYLYAKDSQGTSVEGVFDLDRMIGMYEISATTIRLVFEPAKPLGELTGSTSRVNDYIELTTNNGENGLAFDDLVNRFTSRKPSSPILDLVTLSDSITACPVVSTFA